MQDISGDDAQNQGCDNREQQSCTNGDSYARGGNLCFAAALEWTL
jgi:hypothetical protein